MKYTIGFIVIIIGTLLVLKSEWLINNFGRVEWADQHLGTEGGTRIFYKILGIILIVGSFLVMSGAFNGMLRGMFGGAFRETITTNQDAGQY
jgi:hypothetical protein